MTAANQPCVQKLQGCTNSLESCRGSVGNIELFQISRERSKKTEAVFLGAFKEAPGGKIEIPRAHFLFVTFSFGEAKEKVKLQLQISMSVLVLMRAPYQLPFQESLGCRRR